MDTRELRSKSSCQCGRTWRRRRRKKQRVREQGLASCAADASLVLVKLNQWLCSRGYKTSSHSKLKPAFFANTGRGLMATRGISVGDVLISIPQQVLVTCSDVLRDAELRKYFQDSQSKLRAMEILSFFLLYHKYLGDNSDWKPYLDSLPEDYTVPAYCSKREIDIFPEFLRSHVTKQEEDVDQCYINIQKILLGNSKTEQVFSSLCIDDVKWGWFTVNTRAVFLKNKNPASLIADEDICALAPYLDLLNHSYSAQVTAGINEKNECYEIISQVTYGPFEQVFINYGPHDNIKLYVEYGFILPDNPHNFVPLSLDEIVAAVMSIPDNHIRKAVIYEKRRLIQSHEIDKNLGVTTDGPSWNLEVATTICLMTPDEMSQWQVVYEDLCSVFHRKLVVECMSLAIQQKVHQLRSCLVKVVDLHRCSEAFIIGKNLLEECCTILENTKVV